jgi:hypothetical protein
MSFPDLTPTSTTSAITLPETSTDTDAVLTGSLAVGFYTGSAFIAGAKAQVAYTYKRLGGDVLDIELTAKNVYNHYEEAVLEYSYIVNQVYDLQSIVSSSQATNSWDGMGNKRIKVRQVYYISPKQMWRFYGYYGGLNVVGDFHNYGQYADDSTFNVIPPWQNKLQAISYEDHLYTRTSHYSYEIIDNKLKLYPTPSSVSPEKFWFRFTVENDGGAYATGSYDSGVDGVNNMNTLPMENIAFNKINSIGQQWIRRFALALSKETLGQVRGKFGGSVPIPGDNVSLNASDLLSQASTEQQALREELNKQLDEMLYSKLAEVDKAMVDNMDSIVSKTPLKIFVG